MGRMRVNLSNMFVFAYLHFYFLFYLLIMFNIFFKYYLLYYMTRPHHARVNWSKYVPLFLVDCNKLIWLFLFIILLSRTLRGYCTPGPYFWRFCAFSQKIKQLWTKYPMDLVRNVPRNSKITVLLQQRPLLWSYSEKCAKINIFHVLNHKSITTWVSEIPVQ